MSDRLRARRRADSRDQPRIELGHRVTARPNACNAASLIAYTDASLNADAAASLMTGTAERLCATALTYTLYAYGMCLSTRVGKQANVTMARLFTMSVRLVGRRDHLSLSGERVSTNRWLLNIASLTAPLRRSPSLSRSGGSFFHAVDQSPTPRLLCAPLPGQCPLAPRIPAGSDRLTDLPKGHAAVARAARSSPPRSGVHTPPGESIGNSLSAPLDAVQGVV